MLDGNLNPHEWMKSTRNACDSLWDRSCFFVSACITAPVHGKTTQISERWYASVSAKPSLTTHTSHPQPGTRIPFLAPQIPMFLRCATGPTPLWLLGRSPPQTRDGWWWDSLSFLWVAHWLPNELRLAGWEPERNIGKDIEQLCPYLFSTHLFICWFIHLWNDLKFIKERGSRSVFYSWKTSLRLQHLSHDINHKLTESLLCAIWTAHQLRLSEKQMRLWRKGAKVSKICSFIRVKLGKTHTFFHMIWSWLLSAPYST